METEIWKPVVGYEGLYEISTFGRVKSLRKNKILIRNNKLQYIQIELWDNGKYKRETVHRLVAQAFIENTESKPMVNHKNGIKNECISYCCNGKTKTAGKYKWQFDLLSKI